MLLKSAWALALSLAVAAFAADAQRDPALAAAAATKEAPQPGKLEQIIPGHYVYSNGARISGVIATSEGVVVLDALSNEAMAKDERRLIQEQIRLPVKYLISGTFHNNYALGNIAYQDAIRIGHENYKTDLIAQMKMDNRPQAQQQMILPHLTFRDKMTITLGGKEIQILYLGRAHTRGDAAVFVPQDRIVYLSEIFFDGRFPFGDDAYVEWIATIDNALKLEADIFVPGQGPSMVASAPRMSREALMRARAVLVNFRDNVQREIMRGATEEQAVAAIQLPEYRTMVGYDQQRAVLVRRMYQDLKGQIR
jgi:glyoxylase-like metal-dependent hydrolase (beta-lactamase superfamily II)